MNTSGVHECLDHLGYRENEWREPHGEPCSQSWYECAVCGEAFTEQELLSLSGVADA